MTYILAALLVSLTSYNPSMAAQAASDPLQEALAAPNLIQSREILAKAFANAQGDAAWPIAAALVSLDRLRGNESDALKTLRACQGKCGQMPENTTLKGIRDWACGKKQEKFDFCR